MNVAETLRAATVRLAAAGVPDPAHDARRLLAHALRLMPDRLAVVMHDALDDEACDRFDAAVTARTTRQPVSQITGRRAFWGRDFIVTPDVLDPRPETETLIALALTAPFTRVLDLGTGSGAILLTLLAERPATTGTGTDLSAAALSVAARNAAALDLAGRATFARSDWFGAVGGSYDLIVSNPPYIAEQEMVDLSPDVRDHEPRMALTPGGDGLGAYRAIAAGAADALAPGGQLMVEIGPSQGQSVAALFAQSGLQAVAIHPDLDGRDRVVCARIPRAEPVKPR